MNPATPYVYINDDEIELKKIIILCGNPNPAEPEPNRIELNP
jgi:hypothetical protein